MLRRRNGGSLLTMSENHQYDCETEQHCEEKSNVFDIGSRRCFDY